MCCLRKTEHAMGRPTWRGRLGLLVVSAALAVLHDAPKVAADVVIQSDNVTFPPYE